MNRTRPHPILHRLAAVCLLLALTGLPGSGRGAAVLSDADISDHVQQEYRFDSAVPFNRVDVSTAQGIVTLSGTVSNLLASERAARIAGTVRGVRAVVNRIVVEPAGERSATQLRESVAAALSFDPAIQARDISVLADDDGRVVLAGTVASWAGRTLAETVTKGVAGVTRVDDRIRVTVQPVRPDSEIRREVERRLYRDTLVGDELIDVRVTDGRVFLSGITGSAAEKRRAVVDAWISGVQSIDSAGLDVEAGVRDEAVREAQDTGRSDREIRAAVQDALQADPRVAAFAIDVGIDNGRVTLHGAVDNILARKTAARDARNTVGVSSVNNLIKVRPRTAPGDDGKLAKTVRGALLRNLYVGDYGIAARVNAHVAYLEGTVDSYFDKAEAESTAERAAGVSAVRNHLQVGSPATLTYNPYVSAWSIYDYPWYRVPEIHPGSDHAIGSDIGSELFWSPFVDAGQVSVAVEGGVATLTGAADSTGEDRAAVQNALEGGATGVIDRLVVIDMNGRRVPAGGSRCAGRNRVARLRPRTAGESP